MPLPRMTADDEQPAGFSLRRWSRRKLLAARATPTATSAPPIAEPVDPPPMPTATAAATATAGGDAAAPAAAALPPVETLTFDSDFTAYLQPKVDEALKRNALRKLFRDPRFNVMDGLDVYIDDYSIPDPIAPEMVRELMQSRYLFDPPQTRINAEGFVEDVPADERAPAAERTGTDAPAAIAAAGGASAAVPAPTAPRAAGPDAGAPQTAARTASSDPPDAAAPIHPAAAARTDR